MAARSPRMAASATSLPAAAAADAARDDVSNQTHETRVARMRPGLLEVVEPAGTVSELGTVDTEQVEHAHQQVAGRNRLARIRQMPVTAKGAGGASDEHM